MSSGWTRCSLGTGWGKNSGTGWSSLPAIFSHSHSSILSLVLQKVQFPNALELSRRSSSMAQPAHSWASCWFWNPTWRYTALGYFLKGSPDFPSSLFPGDSSGKEPTCQCRRDTGLSLGQKIPQRRKWQPAPVFLPGEYHGQGSLQSTGLQSHSGLKQLNTHKCYLHAE